MSIYGAMIAAISGLSAQSRKMGHISDNIANVNTVSYKKIGTSFSQLVTQSSQRNHSPSGVVSQPDFNVSLQGAIQSSPRSTHVAINGNGFFVVRNVDDSIDRGGLDQQILYTRKGDFEIDQNGNLVNSSGYFLMGARYTLATDTIDSQEVEVVDVSDFTGIAEPTAKVTLGANLPAESTVLNTLSSWTRGITGPATAAGNVVVTIPGYVGGAFNVAVANGDTSLQVMNAVAQQINAATATNGGYTAAVANNELVIYGPNDGVTDVSAATVDVSGVAGLGYSGGATGQAPVPALTAVALGDAPHFSEQVYYDEQGQAHTVRIEYVKTADNSWTMRFLERDLANNWLQLHTEALAFNPDGTLLTGGASGVVSLDPRTFSGSTNPPWQWASSNTIDVSIGEAGKPVGITQYSSEFAITDLRQDGLPFGQFQDVSIDEFGDVWAHFGNGASRRIFKLPIATFSNPDGLQLADGNAYQATVYSGDESRLFAGVGRAGMLVSESLENSNVDLAEEFTNMIQAQRAYSANSRVITTSDQMLEEVVNLKR